MDKFRMLSGAELVAQGAKKASVSLPEIGLKDVFPNGSWLEQKQIQNALEARKHLIEVERIDKVGVLSLAHWREDLKLAEVTQKCGGHWQYLGHTVGQHWYIYPEETLLLMEMNCLQLKHNGVIVSIQQAYSLLLNHSVSLVQYKVYASLSRLGYKVFRHDKSLTYNTVNMEAENFSIHSNTEQDGEVMDIPKITDVQMNNTEVCETETDVKTGTEGDGQSMTTVKEEENKLNEKESVTMEINNTNENFEVSSSVNLCEESSESPSDFTVVSADMCSKGSTAFIQNRLESLCSREVKPCSLYVVHQSFKENLPDLYQKHVVTIKAPEEQHIPRNVFLNNTAYVLNLGNLRLKNVNPAPSSSSHTYSSSDDVNEQHVRRIRSSFSNESTHNTWTQVFPNMRFPQQTNHYRQFNYWSHYNFNLAFQRPFYPGMPLRFQVFPRMHPMFRCSSPVFTPSSNITDPGRPQKRKREGTKKYHLDSIKKLALKLKSLVQSGNTQEQNILALQRLINTYNIRYKAKLQLTDALEVVENEIILETIDLEDDDQSSPKKKRSGDESNSYEQNLDTLKKIALKIKELESKNESSPRHRRAFSNAVKTFNKSYDADIYVNSHYEVIDRRQIVITSSSDPESAVEVTPKPKKSKKLRNPFYILKQLSEKQNATGDHNSKKETSIDSDCTPRKNFEYSELLRNTFNKNWLPSEDDFGRAEVIRRCPMSRLRDHSEEFLYEFMRGHFHKNWLDAKIAYWQSCKESTIKFEANSQNQSNVKLNSIINPEDCTDLKSVLKKLSIIKTNKDVMDECSLNIDFDIYHRDVQNFKKTNKPKPHFRIICIEESCKFPSGVELTTLRSKYTDGISIVFAVVGTASVSYLQINPTDLPVYIPTGNLP